MKRHKKRKLKTSVKVFLLFIIISFSVTSYFALNNNSFSYLKNNVKDSKDVTKDNEQTPQEEVYKVSLLATGDGLVHNTLAEYAKKSDGSYDFSSYLTEVTDIIKNYDIVYYNQETPFGTDESNYSYYPTFSVPSEFGDAMVRAGFNLVSLASNHAFDKGESGVSRSLAYWKTKDVIYNGMALSESERTNYQIGEKNNITYAMLSYTYGTNGLNVPSSKNYLVSVFDKQTALEDINYLRDKVDVLIVAMHWGEEYLLTATDTQKEQAKWLAQNGVDIVIGNHSHCLEPIEWIDDTLVIYSLGNFISNQGILKGGNYTYNGTVKGTIGAFAMLDITKTVDSSKKATITLDNLKVDLLYTYKNSKEKYYKVLPFSKINSEYLSKFPNVDSNYWYLSDYESVYNMYSSVIQKYDKDIYILPLAS
jgi:poly-gamma-glutamate synthesis protein (capsule biosynthesis protein)